MAIATNTTSSLLLSSSLLLCFPQNHHSSIHFRPPITTTIKSFLSIPKSNSSSNPPIQIILKPQENTIPKQPNPPTTDSLHNQAKFHDLLRLSVRRNDYNLARIIHASVLKAVEDIHIFNALITAYFKLGRSVEGQNVFASLTSPNVVSYNSMISACAKSDRVYKAIRVFFEMRHSGIEPDEYTFVAILTACSRILDSGLGAQIHSLVIKMGYCSCVYVCNVLMDFYLKWGCVDFAIKVFDEMPQRDLASWNTAISGLVKDFRYEKAFELFRDFQRIDGSRVDYFTISSLLTASKEYDRRMEGREIHAHAIRIGLESNLSVNNALIGFYTNCGRLENVVTLFERTLFRDVITWTGMITAYMEFGLLESAVKVFYQMPTRNCVSYNALLAGFSQNGEGSLALELFQGMLEEGMELNDFTLTSIINACAVLSEVEVSKQIHGFVIKSGFGSNTWIETALLDMYTKCGRMANAKKLFSQCSFKKNDSIPWTSMMCGYANNGQPNEALSLFFMMQADEGLFVDKVASATILSVCATLGLHEMGKQIHCYVAKSGFLHPIGVGNFTLSMYAKCGNMDDAVKFFNLMPKHDRMSWNALLSGYILHRNGDRALLAWSKMGEMGVKPDSITFEMILSAYKYSDLQSVDSCRRLFLSMRDVYGIEPLSEHYASMVSVLGYWDCFDEAEEMISEMPFEADALVWRALLDICRLKSNTSLGKRAAKHLLAMEPQDASTYIIVTNLYSASGRWHCSERIRQEMRAKGLKKYPAQSWIVHQHKIHFFYARDQSHQQTQDIYSGLDILISECIKAGYVPDTSFVLHEVEEHQKKDFLCYHSAKLAVSYGLLMMKPGKPIRVVKNIVLCGDCHTFLKYVSSVTRREITLRDSSGFHCFRDGLCSCRDYC